MKDRPGVTPRNSGLKALADLMEPERKFRFKLERDVLESPPRRH